MIPQDPPIAVDPSTIIVHIMEAIAPALLDGAALDSWRSYLKSHATILRALDADLIAQHGMTTRDYEVLLYLSQAPERKLPMSALAESTMLTRSGITRLVDGLVAGGLIERVSCRTDARVSYAQLTDAGYEKLRQAGRTHVASIREMFLEHFTPEEIEQLASLLSRLPGGGGSGACTAE
jgi:DNA-binding MarR family transcriptional regulator